MKQSIKEKHYTTIIIIITIIMQNEVNIQNIDYLQTKL